MRVMTELSITKSSTTAVHARLATALAAIALAACSESPTRVTMPAANQGNITTATSVSSEQGVSQTWQDFAARGWNCRTPNNGPVTVCSPPNQALPTVALPPAVPPADRPETVMLKRWRDGVFEANVLLIRPEVYNGQPCSSTGQSYIFVGVLGYFECAHITGD